MIHTKLLIRRLAYVPWLLTFGLVLGWAGEAQAQDVRLTVVKKSIREDAGVTKFTVTATNHATPDAADDAKTPVTGAKYVLLQYTDDAEDNGGFGFNYTVTQAVITIPDKTNTGSAEITITPIAKDSVGDPGSEDDGQNADFTITIGGTAGDAFGGAIESTAAILFIDTHKATSEITLSFSPAEVSQEAGPTTITVTATLNGETLLRDSLTFPLVVVGASDSGEDATTNDVRSGDVPILPAGIEPGIRDRNYKIPSMPTITIPRKKVKGTATFTIDPSKGPRWVGVGTTLPFSAGHVDALRYDADLLKDDPLTPNQDESLQVDLVRSDEANAGRFTEGARDTGLGRSPHYNREKGC